jgi:hypothetical protein
MLVLAQVLKSDVPNYKGMPNTVVGKTAFCEKQLEEYILPNFKSHRKILYPKLIEWGFQNQELVASLQQMEDQILLDFKNLSSKPHITAQNLDDLGYALDALVRLKERELYELLQVQFNEQLTGLDTELG